MATDNIVPFQLDPWRPCVECGGRFKPSPEWPYLTLCSQDCREARKLALLERTAPPEFYYE